MCNKRTYCAYYLTNRTMKYHRQHNSIIIYLFFSSLLFHIRLPSLCLASSLLENIRHSCARAQSKHLQFFLSALHITNRNREEKPIVSLSKWRYFVYSGWLCNRCTDRFLTSTTICDRNNEKRKLYDNPTAKQSSVYFSLWIQALIVCLFTLNKCIWTVLF